MPSIKSAPVRKAVRGTHLAGPDAGGHRGTWFPATATLLPAHPVSLCAASKRWRAGEYSTNIDHQPSPARIFLSGESLGSCVPIGLRGAWPPLGTENIHHYSSYFPNDDFLKMGCSLGDICTHFCFLVSINRIFSLMMQPTRQTQNDN